MKHDPLPVDVRALLEREARLEDRERQLALQNLLFMAAVKHLPYGLSMYDGDMRMIMCNAKYLEMYKLDPEVVTPGISSEALAAARFAAGTAPKTEQPGDYIRDRSQMPVDHELYASDRELADGRICSVVRQPVPGGGWVSLHRDVTRKRELERKIAFLAHNDALTGLANRVRLNEEIRKSLSRLNRRGEHFAVMCLDLDHFKAVNDTLGHPAGDALLKQVAERLRSCLRDTDLVSRVGGDEFAIVQSSVDQAGGATVLAERIIAVMSAPFELGENKVVIGTTVGIALAPQDGSDPETLLKNADLALYRAKANGRGTLCYFSADLDALAKQRRQMEGDLRRAMAEGELQLFYQPIVNLREERIGGFEALMRWNHPTRGELLPEEFMSFAEETGLIIPMGEWAIRQACMDAKSWGPDLHVAVNVSPVQFRNKSLVTTIVGALAQSGLSPNRLEVEVTEAVLLRNSEVTLAILHQLRGLGVRVSMDGFGSGYTSMTYLRSFPFDKIKIDQGFVHDLAKAPEAVAIMRAVTGLGASFGITTTAEGVETKRQLDMMKAEGCSEIQGYFYGRPTPVEEVADVLKSFHNLLRTAA